MSWTFVCFVQAEAQDPTDAVDVLDISSKLDPSYEQVYTSAVYVL